MNPKKIYVEEYGISPNNIDNTFALNKLLNQFRSEKNIILYFGHHEYHFLPDYGVERLLYISNHHEDTIKKIIFDLSEYENLIIDGGNATFMFYTDCIPFYIHKGKNVELKNFKMDFARPSYSEGKILSVNADKTKVYIDNGKYPHKVEHGRLFFYGDNYGHELTEWLEFDSVRKAPVEQILDMYINHNPEDTSMMCTQIDENEVLFERTDGKRFLPQSREGNLLVLRHHPRSHPGFYVTYSNSISVMNVTCYHATGIGFMAEHTYNILLNKFDICRENDQSRIFTAAADATHFVYCSGSIEISNCLFENQLDDAANIHGIYAVINKILSENEFIIELVHNMQKGVKIAEKGEKIAILNRSSLEDIEEAIVIESRFINKDYQYIKIDKAIEDLAIGQIIENRNWIPDIYIHDCVFRNNRARGLLLTSAGKTIIEHNVFQNAGAAILIEGDSNNWFESGSTNDIIIRENKFENCSYVSDWGFAPIQVTPRIMDQNTVNYHKNISIKDNDFILFDNRVLYARHVGKLTFMNNRIHSRERFKAQPGQWANCNHIKEFIHDMN